MFPRFDVVKEIAAIDIASRRMPLTFARADGTVVTLRLHVNDLEWLRRALESRIAAYQRDRSRQSQSINSAGTPSEAGSIPGGSGTAPSSKSDKAANGE